MKILGRARQNLSWKVASTVAVCGLGLGAVLFALLWFLPFFRSQTVTFWSAVLSAAAILVIQTWLTYAFLQSWLVKRLRKIKEQLQKTGAEPASQNAYPDELAEISDSFAQTLTRMRDIHERKNSVEKLLTKTEQSLKFKTELEAKSKIIERMNQELTQSFNNVALLYNVSQHLNAILDLNELQASVQHIFEEKFLCHQYILYLTADENLLRPVNFKGFDDHSQWTDRTVAFGDGLSGLVASSQKALYVQNIAESSLKRCGLENEMRGSVFCAPLVSRGKLIGVLLVARAARDAFSATDRQSLEAIATQIANAHDRSVLYTQTKELAVRDELTGLYNRRHFQQTLEKELKRSERYARPMSILMIDVDHFKLFNDTYGHLKGDITLKTIAAILSHNLREIDVLARYGGEEFVVLLPNTGPAGALVVAEKLRSKIADDLKIDIPPAHGKPPVPITISVGVSSYPETETLGELIHAADMALYKAKRQGRNLVMPSQSAETGATFPTFRKSGVNS